MSFSKKRGTRLRLSSDALQRILAGGVKLRATGGGDRWEVEKSLRADGAMAREKMLLGAASPRADKIIIQRAAETGADDWNQPARPFFRDFGADFDGDAVDDSRDEAFDGLFFHEIAAQIESGCAGGGHP